MLVCFRETASKKERSGLVDNRQQNVISAFDDRRLGALLGGQRRRSAMLIYCRIGRVLVEMLGSLTRHPPFM